MFLNCLLLLNTIFASIPPFEKERTITLDEYLVKAQETERLSPEEIDIFLTAFPTQESINQFSEEDILKIGYIYRQIPENMLYNHLESLAINPKLYKRFSDEKFNFENKEHGNTFDNSDSAMSPEAIEGALNWIELLQDIGILGNEKYRNEELERDIRDLLYGDDDDDDDDDQ